jgi:hypothetical protein
MERDGTPVRVMLQDERALPHRPASLFIPNTRTPTGGCMRGRSHARATACFPSIGMSGSERDLYGARSFYTSGEFVLRLSFSNFFLG